MKFSIYLSFSVLSFLYSTLSLSAVPRFVFAVNSYDSSVSSYRVDADNGNLYHQHREVTDRFPSTLVLHPNGKFLYVCSQTIDTIQVFSVDQANGKLTILPDAGINSSVRSPFDMNISQDGKYLFIPGRHSWDISVFAINKTSGKLKTVLESPVKTAGERARFISVHPNNKFVYAVNTYSDVISGFLFDAKKKTLTATKKSPFSTGASPQDMVIHPNGKYLYINNWVGGDVSSYKISPTDGELIPFGSGNAAAGTFPFGISMHPSGDFLYSANWASANISAFAVSTEDGSLSKHGEPVSTQSVGPVTLEWESNGKFAYSPNYNDNTIAVLKYLGNGGIELQSHTKTRSGPRRIAILSGDKPVHVDTEYFVVATNKEVSAFKDVASLHKTKKLATFKNKATPNLLQLDSQQGNIIVSFRGENKLSILKLSERENELREVSSQTKLESGVPQLMRLDHESQYLYLQTTDTFTGKNYFSAYELNAEKSTLVLSETQKRPSRSEASDLVVDPAGRYALLTDRENDNLAIYRYSTNTSPLTAEVDDIGSPFSTDKLPQSVMFDPKGQYAFIANQQAKAITVYDIDPQSGAAKLLEKSSVNTEFAPKKLAIHPGAKFLYAVSATAKSLHIFSIDTRSGKLSSRGKSIPLSYGAKDVQIDPSGKRLYVIFKEKNQIARFNVLEGGAKLKAVSALKVHGNVSSIAFKSRLH